MESSSIWIDAVRAQLDLLTALADKQLQTLSSSSHSKPLHTLREIIVSQNEYFSSLLNMASDQVSSEDQKFHKLLESSQMNQMKLRDEISFLKERIARAPPKPQAAPPSLPPAKMVKVRAAISPPARKKTSADLEELAGLQIKLQRQVQELQQIASSTSSFARPTKPVDLVKEAVTQRMSLDFANEIQFSGRPLVEDDELRRN